MLSDRLQAHSKLNAMVGTKSWHSQKTNRWVKMVPGGMICFRDLLLVVEDKANFFFLFLICAYEHKKISVHIQEMMDFWERSIGNLSKVDWYCYFLHSSSEVVFFQHIWSVRFCVRIRLSGIPGLIKFVHVSSPSLHATGTRLHNRCVYNWHSPV